MNVKIEIGHSHRDTIVVDGKRVGSITWVQEQNHYVARNEIGWHLGAYDRAEAIKTVATFRYDEWELVSEWSTRARKKSGKGGSQEC